MDPDRSEGAGTICAEEGVDGIRTGAIGRLESWRGAYALALRCSQVTMRKRHRPLRTLCTKPKAAIMLMIQTDRKTIQAQKRRSAAAPPFDRISLYLNEMRGGHDKD